MSVTTRHGVCGLRLDELRAVFGVRSTRQAIRRTEGCEELLSALAAGQAEAAARGKKVRADQVLDSICRRCRRLLAAMGEPAFAAHALVVVRRAFDAAAEGALHRAARRLDAPPNRSQPAARPADQRYLREVPPAAALRRRA